jgi:hypothetical protein
VSPDTYCFPSTDNAMLRAHGNPLPEEANMADGPRQPECAGGIRKTSDPPKESLGRELAHYTAQLARAHAEQLQLDAEFDAALGEGRR